MNVIVTTVSALTLTAFLSACASNDEQATSASANDAATASEEALSVADSSSEPRLDPDARRCKTEIKTGTRISNKICKTNREWEQEAIDSRTAAEAIQRGSVNGPGPSGG